jgi:hypothetical protein
MSHSSGASGSVGVGPRQRRLCILPVGTHDPRMRGWLQTLERREHVGFVCCVDLAGRHVVECKGTGTDLTFALALQKLDTHLTVID